MRHDFLSFLAPPAFCCDTPIRPWIGRRAGFWLLVMAMPISMPAHAAGCTLPKSYYKNVSCTSSRSYFLAIKDFGAPVALLNRKGQAIIDVSRYQKIATNKITGGLIPVQRGHKLGYINRQGREVIPVVYDLLDEETGWARGVVDGRIVVKKNGRYGVISSTNKTIVPFSAAIDNIADYQNGVARVDKGRVVSWRDKNGKRVNHPSATNRSNTTNTVSSTASILRPSPPPSFTTLTPRQQDGKWGFVDDHGVMMITYSFDEARAFSEGLAGVRIDGEWGFVNLGGDLVIPFGFADRGVSPDGLYKRQPAFVFTGGKAWIGNLKNGNKMCIDKKGAGVSCGE